MKLLKEIVRMQGLNLDGKAIHRDAVRAVIIEGRRLLLIYSPKDRDYKFPGGGVSAGETKQTALIREVREESGATVLSIDEELGKVIELDTPSEEGYDVFRMVSFYYLCTIHPVLGEQTLEQYERELGFTPVWADIDETISANKTLMHSTNFPRWTPRETFVLQYIKEKYRL